MNHIFVLDNYRAASPRILQHLVLCGKVFNEGFFTAFQGFLLPALPISFIH
jgi:hypothetical protein